MKCTDLSGPIGGMLVTAAALLQLTLHIVQSGPLLVGPDRPPRTTPYLLLGGAALVLSVTGRILGPRTAFASRGASAV